MKKLNVIFSSLGNVLEWFDFGLFIYLAPILGQQFFPLSIENATLASLGVFAAGFISRPLGGIIFGHLGDRYGRSGTLRFSILITSLTTLCIGILPGYQAIGNFAPIIFLSLRIIQGLAIGGEYSGIMIYLYESTQLKKRGLFTSFAAVGANLGFLFVTLIILLLKIIFPEKIITAWAFRLPFILVGLFGFIIFYFRFNLPETPEFAKIQNIRRLPLLDAFKNVPRSMLKILGLSCMGSTFYYIFFGYMPNYLHQELGISSKFAFSVQAISLCLMLFLVPLAGICGDKLGRRKMLLWIASSIIFFTIPCFLLLNIKTNLAIYLAFLIATILSSGEQGNSLATVVETCPVDLRYSGISLPYNLGGALFGSTAPMIVNLLTRYGQAITPAYYLIFMASISLIAILSLQKHSHSEIFKLDFDDKSLNPLKYE